MGDERVGKEGGRNVLRTMPSGLYTLTAEMAMLDFAIP